MTLGMQLPQYCQDLDYGAFLDRYLISDLGVQSGVVTSNSFKVSASTGLQVSVADGGAFVESENGMYHQSSTAAENPYNTVVVSSANPQIAQIILRIYDVNELKIGGSSFGRLEWLNGTPTASATKANMEAEKFEGAAEMPEASLRLARILVPKNATSSSEYYVEDARRFSEKIKIGSPTALVSKSFETKYLVSNTRLSFVTYQVSLSSETAIQIQSYIPPVEANVVRANCENKNANTIVDSFTIPMSPGEKWKAVKTGVNSASIFAAYYIM